jgi:hypothetical protein
MTTDWEYTCVHLVRFGYPTRQAPLITVAALVALLWWYTIPTTPLDLAVSFSWLWDAPGECSVTGHIHLQVGQ